jgi:hypothetical protein
MTPFILNDSLCGIADKSMRVLLLLLIALDFANLIAFWYGRLFAKYKLYTNCSLDVP